MVPKARSSRQVHRQSETEGPHFDSREGKAEVVNGAARLSSTSNEDNDSSDASSARGHRVVALAELENSRPRKRKRVLNDDLEGMYLNRLAREELKEQREQEDARNLEAEGQDHEMAESVAAMSMDGEEEPISMHETATGSDKAAVLGQTARTVFLGNVSTDAIKSKSARKTLLAHLSVPLTTLGKGDEAHRVESLRFRSTPFVSNAGPKKAAYTKKELMDDTASSTNAYAVYTTEVAARTAVSRLNGTIVLDRHLRADYAAKPDWIDHRRCVFVGNLSFVDREATEPPENGDQPRRPKAKDPADAEEGLWRTFGKAGKVESVRVVRDKETRVGKGFAYVQFADENGVEAALLYNDKKFPPMLPRKLRVMRAKRRPKPRKEDNRESRDGNALKVKSGRVASRGTMKKLRPYGGNATHLGAGHGNKNLIFEGHRASSSANDKDSIFKGKKRKPTKGSNRRAAAFKAGGGKRKREK